VFGLVSALVLHHVSHDHGKYTIFPLLSFCVHAPEQFVRCDGLRVSNFGDTFLSASGTSTSKSLPDLGFTTTWVSDNESGVSYLKDFSELMAFKSKV
jgi:hypothetical protein